MSSLPPSKETLLDVWRRVVSTDYRHAIESDPESLRIFQSLAAQYADIAARIHRTHQAGFMLPSAYQTGDPASSFRRAECTIQVNREFGYHEERTIGAGAMVLEDRIYKPPRPGGVGVPVFGGRVYRNRDAFTLGVGESAVADVTFEAESPGYGSNLAHLLDTDTGFLEEGRLVLRDQSRARANIGGSITAVDLTNGIVTITDAGKPDVFERLDIGLYVRLDQTANLANQSLTLRILGFEQPLAEVPVGSGLFPNVIFCEIPAGATPVVESGSVKWTLLDWKDQGFNLSDVGVPLGGRDDELFLLGDGRGVYQQQDESDDAFRQRVARLPDVITPAAIRRQMNRVLQPFNYRGLAVDLQDFNGLFWDEDFLDYYTAGDTGFVHGTARVVSTSDVALPVTPVAVDGVTINNGDRILLAGQTSADENGVYIDAAGTLARDPDWGFGPGVTALNFLTAIEEGTTFADTVWKVDTGDVIGVDNLTISQLTLDDFPEAELEINVPTKLLLSIQEAYGWGFIYLPFIGEGEFGFGYDDGPLVLLSPGVFLGSAWDEAFFDGYPVEGYQAYASIFATLNPIKLGGVGLTFIRTTALNT